MKRILIIVILLFLTTNVYALEDEIIEENNEVKIEAKLIKCDSSSNIWLQYNDEIKRVKLLAYNMEDGNLNNEINNYICKMLEDANKIEIEYDIEKKDNYNREQVYIFVNDELLQNNLLSKGYGQVNNVTGDYKYTNEMCEHQKLAISKGIGIWEYPNIKESYCNSGIEIGSNILEKDDKKETKENKININYENIIFLNIIIILLMLLIRRSR